MFSQRELDLRGVMSYLKLIQIQAHPAEWTCLREKNEQILL